MSAWVSRAVVYNRRTLDGGAVAETVVYAEGRSAGGGGLTEEPFFFENKM